MKDVLKILNQRPIAYYPIYRQITGSTTAGILLSQLMYWFSKKNKFYKTDSEIREETLLTEKELKNAKSKIKKLHFIKITREGVPAKTYYQIDWDEFERALNFYSKPNKIDKNDQTSLDERDKLYGTKRTNCMGRKGQTISKITSETTSESNIKKEKKEKKNSPLREEKEKETITKTNELKKTNATKKTNNSNKPNKTNELQETIGLIREFYKENKLSLTGNKVFQYERKIYDLTKSYSLKEIEEVIKFAKRDKYYKKLLTNPTSLFNNFEGMKLALEDEEEPHFKSAFDFYELNLPKGWIL